MRKTTPRGGAHVTRDTANSPVEVPSVDTRGRFGGLDVPAAFAGALAALGMLALLGVIASGWSSAYTLTLDRSAAVSATGLLVGLVIVAGSCLFGGWVAGRTARYHGAGNGMLAGVVLVLLGGGLGWLLGTMADEASPNFAMPSWLTQDATSNEAIVAASAAAGLALLCSALGGALGSFWHRRVDRSLVTETENAAFAPYPEGQRLVSAPPAYKEDDEQVVDLDRPKRTRARSRTSS